MKAGYVYIVASQTRVIYIGVTSDRMRRMSEHRSLSIEGFSARYHCTSLVFIEESPDMVSAIAREKELKGWSHSKKVALIEETNPMWRDLAEGWFS